MSTSNPLAPSSNPLAPSGQSSSKSSEKVLNNADFRRIMMTPRGQNPATPWNEPATPSHNPLRPETKKGEFKAPPPRVVKKPSQYRDRAEERRKGETSDYNDTEAEEYALRIEDEGPQVLQDDERSSRDIIIERSKFLGGDVEHTHLVKGLDYALLAKVRADKDRQDRERQELEKKEKEVADRYQALMIQTASTLNASQGTETPSTTTTTDKSAPGQKQTKESSPVAQGILGVIKAATSTGAKIKKVDLFDVGRMAFVFDVSSEPHESGPDVPSTLIRSRDETSKDPAARRGAEALATMRLEKMLVDKIATIMHETRARKTDNTDTTPTKTAPSKVTPSSTKPVSTIPSKSSVTSSTSSASSSTSSSSSSSQPQPTPMDSEDIFGDAGSDYVCIPQKKADKKKENPASTPSPSVPTPQIPTSSSSSSSSKPKYFSKVDAVDDLPAMPTVRASDVEQEQGPTQKSAVSPDDDSDLGPAYTNTDDAYPETDSAYPNTDDAYPNTDDAYPDTDSAYPNTDDAYPNTDDAYPNTDDAYPETDGQYQSESRPTEGSPRSGSDSEDDSDVEELMERRKAIKAEMKMMRQADEEEEKKNKKKKTPKQEADRKKVKFNNHFNKVTQAMEKLEADGKRGPMTASAGPRGPEPPTPGRRKMIQIDQKNQKRPRA